MSITSMAKNAVSIPSDPCSAKAFLSAITNAIGSVGVDEGGWQLELSSGNARLLRAAAKLIRDVFGVKPSLKTRTLTLPSPYAFRVLVELGMLYEKGGVKPIHGVSPEIVASPESEAAFCKGVFLASGTVLAPSGGGYHLEFTLSDREFADSFAELLIRRGLPAKLRTKNGRPSVYLKSADAVCDFLALVDASGAVLELNSIAAERQMRQIANRSENCDLANIEKTVRAATELNNKLVGIIDKIDDEQLLKTALLRLERPEATYAELARLLNISKSGLTHRLKRLEQLAADSDE